MSRCACCRAETDADGLCSDCAAVAEAIEGATVDTQRHLLAYALVRSQRDAARRLDKAPTAHNSALGNFARRTGVDRETARRVAVWGLRTGVWQRPAGFEDVSLPEGPGAPSRNGEVKVTQTEPAPGARKKSPKPSKVHSYNFDKEARQAWKDEHEPQPEPADEDPACYGCTNDTSECDTCELTGPCADEAANRVDQEEEDVLEDAAAIREPEIEEALAYLQATEAAYRSAFAVLAVPALGGAMPDLELVQTAYAYGRAKGGYEVLAAIGGAS